MCANMIKRQNDQCWTHTRGRPPTIPVRPGASEEDTEGDTSTSLYFCQYLCLFGIYLVIFGYYPLLANF